MVDKYITVTQLSRYLKYKFDQDPNLNNVFLKGEISNFKEHSRGHLYFTIKDEGSRINAVMFQSQASKLNFKLEDGMKVLVTGRISVYEATGGYQIYVDDLIIDGVGNLYLEYEKLKKKLEALGLFDQSKKKSIPKFPETVGIITAPTGAAIRDILSTIKRRWPITKTILLPSLVQGKEAAPDIVRQIKEAEKYNLDVLIIGRGGGSIEDMWCFNDEQVAYAIYECSIPVISAVGHEIDFTIADFVADLRAPTPTGAAEMAVPNILDFNKYINQVNLRMKQAIEQILKQKRKKLDSLKESYILKKPISIYQIKEQKFDTIFEKINMIMTSKIKDNKNLIKVYLDKINTATMTKIQNNKSKTDIYLDKIKLIITSKIKDNKNLIKVYLDKINTLEKLKYDKKKTNYLNLLNKLELLNPLLTIKRGYSITKFDNKVISSVDNLKIKDNITVELADGIISSEIIKIDKK